MNRVTFLLTSVAGDLCLNHVMFSSNVAALELYTFGSQELSGFAFDKQKYLFTFTLDPKTVECAFFLMQVFDHFFSTVLAACLFLSVEFGFIPLYSPAVKLNTERMRNLTASFVFNNFVHLSYASLHVGRWIVLKTVYLTCTVWGAVCKFII